MDERALLWDALMGEFRELGGIAENVRLGEGPLGRGLFSVNPGLPVRLKVPESLLLPMNFVSFEGGAFRVAANAPLGARQKAFLEAYERHLSWGAHRSETAELLELLQAAPAQLRQLLETPFQANAWLAGANSQAVAERFFAARALDYKGVRVIAPVLDLINHGLGPKFQNAAGIALQGKFTSEVVSRYGPTDPLGIFNRWGFVSSCEFFGLSLGLHLRASWGLLVIERDPDPMVAGGIGGFVPAVSVAGDTIRLSSLLLGHKAAPKLPRGIFYRILGEAGQSGAEEMFDHIQHINRMAYHQLAVAVESAAPPLRRILCNLGHHQLLAMSYNVGASEAV